jgi:myo-inositol-1(or 4)-monophosphatase
VRDIRRAGAASLDLCWTAAGRVDAFFESGLQDWDLAAGALVVRQAGGATRFLTGIVEGAETLVAGPSGLVGRFASLLETASGEAGRGDAGPPS